MDLDEPVGATGMKQLLWLASITNRSRRYLPSVSLWRAKARTNRPSFARSGLGRPFHRYRAMTVNIYW